MDRRVVVVVVLCIFAVYGLGAVENGKNGEKKEIILILKNGMVFDGIHKRFKKKDIMVSGDTITGLYKPGEISAIKAEQVIDVRGNYIIPGLIDAHVHISHSKRAEIEETLKKALMGGITSVRDMGGDARVLASVSRDALLNEIDAPDVFYSALFAGPTFFTDPRVIDGTKGKTPGHTPWAKQITGKTDMVRAIAEARGCGAQGIKIYADLPFEQLKRIVAEAKKQNLKTWSHATVHPAGPMQAVKAGVDVISHTPLLAWHLQDTIPDSYTKRYDTSFDIKMIKSKRFRKLLAEMKKKNTILDATVFIFQLSKGGIPANATSIEVRALFATEATKAAHRYGVKVAVGTDFLLDKKEKLPTLHDELNILVSKCGFSPAQALHAVTVVNAEVIGIEDEVGTIEKGKKANMVVLSDNPLKDIGNTRKIRYVIKSGKLHKK